MCIEFALFVFYEVCSVESLGWQIMLLDLKVPPACSWVAQLGVRVAQCITKAAAAAG
jgi:hypothetical protein